MTEDHDHSRPGPAAMVAALDLADAIYADDRPGISRAAEAACPACTAAAAMSLGINIAEQLAAELVAKLAPGAVLDAGPIRAAIRGLIGEARRELRSAGN